MDDPRKVLHDPSPLGPWHEVYRRLHDGVCLSVRQVQNHPWLVQVTIRDYNGAHYFDAVIGIVDALVEIPYHIDRARAMMVQLEQEPQPNAPTTYKPSA